MRTIDQITEQTLKYINSETTESNHSESVNPISSYLDQAQFMFEKNKLFRNFPIPTISATEIPNANDYVTRTICEVPLIIYRNPQNEIKVFLNVCRHRGAKLATATHVQNCKTFTCPFHGWKYDEGQNLTELKSYTFAGIIWVLLDPETQVSLPQVFSQFEQELNQLEAKTAYAMPDNIFQKNFNWKIGVEAFLEVDHFPFAHAPYLANIQYPGLSLSDQVDNNFRIVVPLQKPTPEQFILNWAQIMYFIFPSSFLLVYSDHIALLSLVPTDIDKTEFRYTPLVKTKVDITSEVIQKKVDFLKVILQQDFDILEDIQKGLYSGANKEMTFTNTEHVLNSFHRLISKARGIINLPI
ncbi:hypothetical protein CIK05_09545 [Bdellovibrio sp. qaytius]|nr:hypothetical protein CIK05_09545 [Bdellovibrio sp. qaytius]